MVHPRLVRAAVSPTAAAATAAGVAIGAADHSVVLAVVLGAAGWLGRMAVAVGRRWRAERRSRPRPAEVDPWSVPEPWRQLLQDAAAAQSRFDRVVATWRPGPTRDRLEELRPRVYAEVAELVILARRGASGSGWPGGDSAGPAAAIGAELRRVAEERSGLEQAGAPGAAELRRREEALAAQLRAATRREEVAGQLQDRLRAAVARLDLTVSDLVATGAASDDGGAGAGVGSALDQLSDGITSLRQALTETAGLGPPPPGGEAP